MAPPDFRCPGMWRLSAGGIPISPVPHSAACQAAVHQHYYEVLTPEERNDPQWDPNNVDHWTTFFTERRLAELAHYEGNNPPRPKNNRGRVLQQGPTGDLKVRPCLVETRREAESAP
jgi:hypothetical protein